MARAAATLATREQFPCFIQKLERVYFAHEPDMVSQVGEERVLYIFRSRGFVAGAERPEAGTRLGLCAGGLDADACGAREASRFRMEIGSGFRERFSAAAACRNVEVVAPEFAGI